MIFQALFGIVLFRLFSLLGLRYTTGFYAGIITSTSPIFFALFAFLIFRDKLNPLSLLSLALGFGGILWMNLQRSTGATLGENPLVGLLFILLAVISEVFLTVFRKSSSGRVSSVSNTLGLAVIALAFFLLPLLIGGTLPDLRSIPLGDWAVLTYLGSSTTALAYILWGDGALRISTLQTGLITLCMPLGAMGLSILILGERPEAGMLPGVFLIISGLTFSLLPGKKPEIVPLKT